MSAPQTSVIRHRLASGARVIFTGRAEGNLSLCAGEGHERGEARRRELARELDLDRLCAGPQVHGSRVHRVRAAEGSAAEPAATPADGHATALRGFGMAVLAADCLPVAIGAPGAVAAVHAGWRGLAAGVLEEGVAAVRELAGPGELCALIGPAAGACCYQVGPEVHAALGEPRSEDGHVDLRSVARRRLCAAGVAVVEDIAACTICDERFFSYRREGARAGRQMVVAWLS